LRIFHASGEAFGPYSSQIRQLDALADDFRQWQAQPVARGARLKSGTDDVRTGWEVRTGCRDVGADDQQSVGSPDDVDAAVRQDGDVTRALGG
jgi:hypothetical protein